MILYKPVEDTDDASVRTFKVGIPIQIILTAFVWLTKVCPDIGTEKNQNKLCLDDLITAKLASIPKNISIFKPDM